MKCFKTITDDDLGLKSIAFDNPRHRFSARGIVLNEDGKIAILYKEAKHEYKLIGGGIEEEEDPIKAFKREALEETGCIVEIDDCLGTTEELKTLDNFKQTSYVYVAHVVKNTKSLNLTEQEKGEGSNLIWLDIGEAIKNIKECETKLVSSKYEGNMSVYHARFIVKRDYAILKYYQKMYGKESSKTL